MNKVEFLSLLLPPGNSFQFPYLFISPLPTYPKFYCPCNDPKGQDIGDGIRKWC